MTFPTTYADLRQYDEEAHDIKMRAYGAYHMLQRGLSPEAHARLHTLTNRIVDHATTRQLIARERLWNNARLPEGGTPAYLYFDDEEGGRTAVRLTDAHFCDRCHRLHTYCQCHQEEYTEEEYDDMYRAGLLDER